MRLIDTEKLEEYKADCCVSLTQWQEGWNDAIDMIMSETPTVDAVPVIRCKDCKFYRQEIDMCDEPYSTAHNVVHEDDFCSKAEREEE